MVGEETEIKHVEEEPMVFFSISRFRQVVILETDTDLARKAAAAAVAETDAQTGPISRAYLIIQRRTPSCIFSISRLPRGLGPPSIKSLDWF